MTGVRGYHNHHCVYGIYMIIEKLHYYILFGDTVRILPLIIAGYGYLLIKSVSYVIRRFIWRQNPDPGDIKELGKAVSLIACFALFFSVFAAVMIPAISSPDPERIVAVNAALMKADKAFFGVYPPFWFHDASNPSKPFFDAYGRVLLEIYRNLSLVLGAILIALFAINYNILLRFLTAFFVAVAISFPFWYVFPALSPMEGYMYNVVNAEFPDEISALIARYQPTPALSAYFNHIKSITTPRDKTFFAITTIPSMHVAWGLMAAFFSIRALPLLAFVLFPYALLNTLSVIYVMQHYAVDIAAGALVSALAIGAATYLVKKFQTGDTVSLIIQKDIRRTIDTIVSLLKHCRVAYNAERLNPVRMGASRLADENLTPLSAISTATSDRNRGSSNGVKDIVTT